MFGDAMSIFARSTHVAFVEVAALHRFEQPQILLDRAIAIRAVLAGLRQRAAVLADVVGVLMIDVREPALDELDGAVVDLRGNSPTRGASGRPNRTRANARRA